MVVTEAIRDYVESKMGRLDKYFRDKDVEASVLLRVSGKRQIVEVTVPTSMYTLRREEEHDDLYAAIDLVTDKLERQIRKNKSKLKKHNRDFNVEYEFDKDESYEDNRVVKRKMVSVKPMSEEEAIIQMELLGHEFFVYRDKDSNEVAVMYLRKDGNYGLIETK